MNTYDMNDIARYAEGEMQPEEQLAFEQTLAVDASLQHQLAMYREVHTSLVHHFGKDEQRDQLQLTLLEMRGTFFGAKPARVVNLKYYLRRGIAVAAVVVGVLLLWRPWQQDLFQQYAGIRMVAPVERGENADSLLQQAVVAFNGGDFSTAASLLQTVTQQQPGNSLAQFYYGVALLHNDRLTEARSMFDQLFQGQSVLKYDAAFYLALTYLKEDNKPACRRWLEKIPSGASSYAKALALLKKL